MNKFILLQVLIWLIRGITSLGRSPHPSLVRRHCKHQQRSQSHGIELSCAPWLDKFSGLTLNKEPLLVLDPVTALIFAGILEYGAFARSLSCNRFNFCRHFRVRFILYGILESIVYGILESILESVSTDFHDLFLNGE